MMAAMTAADRTSRPASLQRADAAGGAQITAHAVWIVHALRAMHAEHAKGTLGAAAGGGLAAWSRGILPGIGTGPGGKCLDDIGNVRFHDRGMG